MNEEQEKKVEEKVEEPVEKTVEQPEEKEPSMTETIQAIKQEYENKLFELNSKKNKEIKERDDVIKQLLSGESTDSPTDPIVDKINSKRNYRKW